MDKNNKNNTDKKKGYIEPRSKKNVPSNYQSQLVGNIDNLHENADSIDSKEE